jgi:hypothetical protein
MEDDTMLWIIGLALGAYVLYQMSQSASASTTAATTVSYHALDPSGQVGTFTGATPGQYPVCDPLHGYPTMPCQVGGTSESY